MATNVKSFSMKKGYSFKVKGKAPANKPTSISSKEIALTPSTFEKIKVQMLVAEGDEVKAGTPILRDKNRPEILFLSPVAGKVTEIEIGRRRVFKAIRIAAAGNDAESFDTLTHDGVKDSQARQLLQNGGLWPLLKENPLDRIPNPEAKTHNIIVKAFDLEPNSWDTSVIAEHYAGSLAAGFKVLKALANVIVLTNGSDSNLDKAIAGSGVQAELLKGKYGTDNAYAYAYQKKLLKKGESFWHTDLQAVGLIGKLATDGKYPSQRIIAMHGSHLKPDARGYYEVTQGAYIEEILEGKLDDDSTLKRIVSGGLITGLKLGMQKHLDYHQNCIQVIGADKPREFMHIFLPGLEKLSYSKAYVSALFRKKEYDFHADINGEERACIQCGICTEVCPVDIMPDMLFKASLAENFTKMEELGSYDCSNCGLCSFVCPSKIEIAEIITEGTRKLIDDE